MEPEKKSESKVEAPKPQEKEKPPSEYVTGEVAAATGAYNEQLHKEMADQKNTDRAPKPTTRAFGRPEITGPDGKAVVKGEKGGDRTDKAEHPTSSPENDATKSREKVSKRDSTEDIGDSKKRSKIDTDDQKNTDRPPKPTSRLLGRPEIVGPDGQIFVKGLEGSTGSDVPLAKDLIDAKPDLARFVQPAQDMPRVQEPAPYRGEPDVVRYSAGPDGQLRPDTGGRVEPDVVRYAAGPDGQVRATDRSRGPEPDIFRYGDGSADAKNISAAGRASESPDVYWKDPRTVERPTLGKDEQEIVKRQRIKLSSQTRIRTQRRTGAEWNQLLTPFGKQRSLTIL